MRARWLLSFLWCATASLAATREVYVWQRQFSSEVTNALQEFAPQVNGFCVLAAEVSWSAGRMKVVRLNPDFRALAAIGKPVGLALRVGGFAGPFLTDDVTTRSLGELAREILVQAQHAGLKVAEFQIDFDAAESKLTGYATWLKALRARIAGTPLVFTALPAWLNQQAFRDLARAADGFVLQVHALERPQGPEVVNALCDPMRALAWVKRASAVGVSFRVALPTYGYVVAFSSAGEFLGLSAEGPRPAWPANAMVRVVRADASEMARLARTLEAEAPPWCTGVIWFRLPIASDRLNWEATTLATVLRGEVPVKDLATEVTWSERGLAEILVVNRGETTEALPRNITVRWQSAERLLAADGLGGFRLDARGAEGQATIAASAVPPDALLAPGRRIKIAWLRFSHELSLDVGFPASPSPR